MPRSPQKPVQCVALVMDELEAIKQKRMAELQSKYSGGVRVFLRLPRRVTTLTGVALALVAASGRCASEPGGGCPGGGAETVGVPSNTLSLCPVLLTRLTSRAAEEQRAAALASVLTAAARERRAWCLRELRSRLWTETSRLLPACCQCHASRW